MLGTPVSVGMEGLPRRFLVTATLMVQEILWSSRFTQESLKIPNEERITRYGLA